MKPRKCCALIWIIHRDGICLLSSLCWPSNSLNSLLRRHIPQSTRSWPGQFVILHGSSSEPKPCRKSQKLRACSPPTTSFVKNSMCSYENQLVQPRSRLAGLILWTLQPGWPRWKRVNRAWLNGRLAASAAGSCLICWIFDFKSIPLSCSNNVARVDKATARGTIEISGTWHL